MKPKFSDWLTPAITLTFLLIALPARGQVPQIINYQGRVTVGGTNFSGTGQFRFSLVNAAGTTTFWSNGVNAVSLPVTQGLYSVLLGDTGIANMTFAIPATVFTNSDVRLRVQFNDGVAGFQTFSPDQRIGAVGYAMMAAGVNSADDIIGRRLKIGVNHTLTGNLATIAGGTNHTAGGMWSAVGGGRQNTASGNSSTVAGGELNTASGNLAVVGGGNGNTASGSSAFIGGGVLNAATNDLTTVGGGSGNRATALYATVGGGFGNQATGVGAFVGGGGADNFNLLGNVASGQASTIGGGLAGTAGGYAATIGGGSYNNAAGQYATIGGGQSNSATNDYATVGGGGFNNATNAHATVGGGFLNSAGDIAATVGGGRENTASGRYATVPGGYTNTASGWYSFAAGRQAKAIHDGAFVWADSQGADFISTTNNQFSIRANGGVRFNDDTGLFFGFTTRQMIHLWGTVYGIGVQNFGLYSRTDPDGGFYWYAGGTHNTATGNAGGGKKLMGLTADQNGAIELGDSTASGTTPYIDFHLGVGSAQDYNVRLVNDADARLTVDGDLNVTGTITPPSDRNVKRDFAPVDGRAVLEKVAALPIQTWAYKSAADIRHLGPVAQDFKAAFGLGADDKSIATVDADGVALAAIKGLYDVVKEKDERIEELENRLAELERRMER